jgi:hypothetical protein
MRKSFILLVAFLLVATTAFGMNVKTVTNNFATGSSADRERVTMEVYNATDMAFGTGDVLAWDLTNDDGRSVTRCNRLGQPVAGVADETIASGTWGTMLVYGYHSAVKTYGGAGYNVTAGYPLYAYGTDPSTSETANTYDGYAGVGQIVGSFTSALNVPFGTALDTYTSTGTASTVEAIVDCL